MKYILDKILFRISLLLIWIISKLPNAILRIIGNFLGIIGFYLMKKRRKIGIKNLTLCFPEMTDFEKQSIIRQHFKYLVTAGLEYSIVFYGSINRIKRLVVLKNEEFFLQHYKKRPIILLSPHFIGLELAASRLSLDVAGYCLYTKQKNQQLNERLKSARLRFMKDKGGEAFSRNEGLRPIIRKLRQTKLAFYYLPDQDLGERDSIYIPFFAHPTCATVNVLPKLVQLTDAVVIPAFVYKGKNNKYTFEFSKPWENYPSDDPKEDIIRINKCIEDMILKALPQYFWLHKRFKSQPNRIKGEIYYE